MTSDSILSIEGIESMITESLKQKLKTLLNKVTGSSDLNILRNKLLKEQDIIREAIWILANINKLYFYRGSNVDNSFSNILKLHGFEDATWNAFSVPKDGNCFWSSLSVTYFGTINFFFLFKVLSLYIIVNHYDVIRRYKIFYDKDSIKENEILKEVLASSNDGEYSIEINLIAASFMLKRDIFVYTEDDNPNLVMKTVYRIDKNNNRPILLALKDKHFSPVLSSNERHKEPLINRYLVVPDNKFTDFKKLLE